MSHPIVSCPACGAGILRTIASVMGGNYYTLRVCGHVVPIPEPQPKSKSESK